ncbi:MAG: flippase-like domain-containing protein [Saprospiraceae bacterium]|nr:flippase-like domain-containing protein [Saprospiraceae bacterium]
MKKHLINFVKFILFLGIGASIMYYLYYTMNISFQEQCRLDGVPPEDCSLIEKILDDFRSVNIFWMGMVFLAFTISNISRMIRWGMLVRNLGYPARNAYLFMSIIIGYLFNLLFPRLGEVVRAGSVAQTEEIPLQKVIGTIVVDRIMDVICLALVLASAFILEYDTITQFVSENQGEDTGKSYTWIWLLGTALLGLGFIWYYQSNRSSLRKLKVFKKGEEIAYGMIEGIKTISNLKKPGWFIFHSANVWFMYFLMTYFCFFAFEPTAGLSPRIGWMVFAFAALGVLIPSPGGMGTVHWLTISALTIYGLDEFASFSFANILFFGVQIFYVIIGGLICLAILAFVRNRKNKKLSSS